MYESLALVFGIFLIAFLFAPVGMGGGMLFAPLLHYGADWPIDGRLLAVSLVLTWSVSIGSGLRHRKEGFYNDEATKSALKGAILGALLGVVIVNALGEDLDLVFKILSVMMLFWSIKKTWSKLRSTPTSAQANASGQDNSTQDSSLEETSIIDTSIQHTPLRIGAGIGGILASVLGIGAGVIYVPVLQQYAKLEPRASIGSSLTIMMMVVPISIIALLSTSPDGFIGTFSHQQWWFYFLPLFAFAGATTGAKFGIAYISTQNIMRVFVILLFIILLRYLNDLSSLIA